MTARGKPGKPKAGFPSFPPSLENPQKQRVSHIPTASTTGPYIKKDKQAGLRPSRKPSTRRVGQNKLPKWAKISCQSQQSAAQRDLAVSLLNRGAKTYRSVESALRRIEDGTYGVCLSCDEPISAKRLHAVPWAEFCLTCQARLDAQARGLGGGADIEDHRSGSAQRD